MSKQKVVFLYCSPSGEKTLNAMMEQHIADLSAEEFSQVMEAFFGTSIRKCRDGHSIRIWFGVDYDDTSPEGAFLKHFLANVSKDDIFFVRFGQQPDDVEEIGHYERMNLPGKE